ncbi:hypothetical protein PQR35_43215, partial [Paraburkholderia sediminicola]
ALMLALSLRRPHFFLGSSAQWLNHGCSPNWEAWQQEGGFLSLYGASTRARDFSLIPALH